MASKWKNKIRGTKQIQEGTIEAAQIAPTRPNTDPKGEYLGIPESKLQLDIPTLTLAATTIQINQNNAVDDGVIVTWPALYLRDTVNGKTYKLYTSNGTLVTEEVTV